MAALNTTTFAYALKKLYTKDRVKNLVYKAAGSPLFAMVNKWEGFGGSNFVEPVIYGDIAGRAATFSDAQANKAASKGVAFTVTRVSDYALASIDSETVLASQGNERAFLEAVKREMDSAANALSRSIAVGLYGDGSGKIGTISAVASSVITLTNLDEVTNFEVGQSIEVAASTAGATRSGTGVITVVDRDAGKVTYSGTITSIAAGDVIFTEGDYVSASDRLKIKGLGAHLPTTAPTSGDSHYSVDRSVDPVRLAGVRVSGSGLRIDEAIFKAAVRVGREGGRPDCVFLSFEKYEELINTLGSKLEYTTTETDAGVGFDGAKVHGPKGVLKVYPDLNCPSDKAYVLTKDVWTLRSLGGAPRILDLDGAKMLRESAADAYEIRWAFYGNLSCKAPGWNAVVSL